MASICRRYAGVDPAALALAGGVGCAALALRLTGIRWGFPAMFNGDEGHHISVAVSLGRGSLDPGVFKYPSLWFYTLFAAFGAFFLAWSGLGLRRGLRDFGQLFAWRPDRFCLLGRLLAAAASMAGLERVYASGVELGEPRLGLWAAGLLAVSFPLVQVAHEAKPDSLMFLWSATSWWAATRYFTRGDPRALLACAACAGLAVSTQYTAAPLAALPAVAWLVERFRETGRPKPSVALGAAALALVPACFLAASPYIVLDHAAFARDLADHASLEYARPAAGLLPLKNALTFAGPWWLCGTLLAVGAAALLRRDRALAALMLLPPLAHIAVLAPEDMGGVARYLSSSLPALALVAAHGVEALASGAGVALAGPRAQAAVLAFLMLPGGLRAGGWARALRLPDTRLAAAAWIAEHVPAGTRVLEGEETDNPPLRSSPAQVRRLLEKTRAAGHARARLYEYMLESHPGGGYEVWHMMREGGEMDSGAWHRRWSESGREVLDVSAGLSAARAAGIQVVILSSMGLGAGTPSVARFVREAAADGTLLAEFQPDPGRVNGPVLRILRIAGGA